MGCGWGKLSFRVSESHGWVGVPRFNFFFIVVIKWGLFYHMNLCFNFCTFWYLKKKILYLVFGQFFVSENSNFTSYNFSFDWRKSTFIHSFLLDSLFFFLSSWLKHCFFVFPIMVCWRSSIFAISEQFAAPYFYRNPIIV